MASVMAVRFPQAADLRWRVAAALCVVNMAFAWRFLHESRDMKEAAEAKANPAPRSRSRDAIVHVVTHSGEPASRLIWIYAIAMGAFQGVTSMLALSTVALTSALLLVT